jgi:enterochelin esterase family protein
MSRSLLFLFAAAAIPMLAQPAAPIVSPEVSPDHHVTFRLKAPNAQTVILAREGAKPLPMQKDDKGVWSVTTEALEPDLYGYSFIADGVSLMDPNNPGIKPNLIAAQSVVHVPGPSSLTWEVNDVPHGTIHHQFYKSEVVGDQRDYYVYTPAGYDAKAKKPYPTLYLLHGFSDDASGWTAVGRAHVILDNLIAQGKAKPMVVVMTLGYGAPEIVTGGWTGVRDPNIGKRNRDKYRDALFAEVMPAIEKDYRVSKDRKMRAIAGLSMGGAESLYTGLNALDRFAYVGAFSAGGGDHDYAAEYPKLDSSANAQLKLLWIACGTEDRLIEPNRKFIEWLKSKDIHLTAVETSGQHTWMVWRRNLSVFAPMLFQDAK